MKVSVVRRKRFSEQTKKLVFDKTDGCCHLCGKKHVFKNYGLKSRGDAVGRWQVDHSNPVGSGGKNHLNNYYVACVTFNREKGQQYSRVFRAKKGLYSIPISKSERLIKEGKQKLLKIGAGGLIDARFGPVGAAFGMAIAAISNL